MAAPVTMTVDARGTIPRSVIRAAEGFHGGEVEQYDGVGMEMELANPNQFPAHESRCTCCPYGYHIDLDFLRYCESLNNGSYLRNLKKIKKNKRKLRKSMEVFLNNQQDGGPPPDVVHSTDTFMNYVEHEDVASRHLLDEIDSSVDNFDLINHSHRRHYKGSGDYDEPDTYYDEYDSGSPSPGYNRQPAYHVQSPHVGGPPPRDPNKYRSETEMVLHQPRKSDSVSSLTSSLSEPNSHPSSGGEYRTTVTETEKRYKTQTHTYITAAQLAGQFAQLMPQQDVPALESAPESSITPEALKAIREQMATSLQRLRELEEQVKIIPVLQVRLSVLKEEKRLQELQLRAKNNKLNTRTIGVGECRIDDYDKPDGRSQSSSPSARMFEMTEFQSFNRKNLRRPNMRSFGVGEGNVFEHQQVAVKQYGWQDNRVHERELHTEESSHIMEKEKEVHTLVIGQEQNRLASIKRGEMRIPTRSIGVGGGNVFDTSSNVHVHEKEMRTVIIGGQEQAKKQHRNVGVSCRATMRDVGVMYYYEDVKPTTRNVAVGVGEGMMVGEFGEGGDSNTTVHQTLTSLQQMNMAAFHTRNINIKSEHLRIILDQMLKKNVHSVGTMCKMSTEDKGTSHDGRYDMVSVGCGTDTVEVDVRPVVATRSIGVENRPALVSRAMITDSPRTSNAGVNTQRSQSVHRATNTQGVDTFPAATNTEEVRMFSVPTETDNKIFQALDQIRNTGTNTTKVYTMNSETNTEHTTRNLKAYTFNSDVAFVDKGINTNIVKQTFSKGQTTDKVRTYSTGVGDHNINQHVDCDICLVKPQTKTMGIATELKQAEEQLVQVKEQEQRQRAELTRHVQASAPSGYTREMTIQSRVRGGSPGNTVTREITESMESKVRGGRRSSPSGMTHEQIMEQALGGGTANFEQMTEEILESQLRGEGSSTTEQIVERTIGSDQPKGRFTQEITIESRSGGSRSPQVSREVITESHSSRGTTGAISGSLRDMLDVQRGISGSGEQRTTTQTTEEVVERTVQSTPRYGQHVTKEVTISGRRGLGGSGTITEIQRSSGGVGGTSTREITEEVVEKRVRSSPMHSGGTVITKEVTIGGRLGGSLGGSSTVTEIQRGSGGFGGTSSSTREVTEEVIERRVRSSPVHSGGTIITKEITMGGRLGGSPRSTSSITESSTSTVIQQETPGGVRIERKPSREERMKNYGVGATKVVTSTTTTEEKTIEPRVRSTQETSITSHSSSSSSSSSSGGSLSMSASGGSSSMSASGGSSSMSASGGSLSISASGGSSSMSASGGASSLSASGGASSLSASGGSSSTVRSGGGDTEVQFMPDGKGGTQMRVVRHTETSYVGNNPVHSESDVVLAGIDRSSTGQQHHSGVSSGGFSSSVTSSSSSSGARRQGGQTITVTETKVERHGAALTEDEGSLRSIMKKPGTSPVPAKKGIKFAEEVSAGFELSQEMKGACSTYAQWLEDSTKVTTKQLNSSVNQIQQEWFKVSSQKLSNPAQVEDFLSSFKEMSPDLLTQVVNMTDANGNSALHYAVSHCNTEVVNLLLDSGATDVDKQNKAGYTAVMLASLATVTDEPQKHAVGRLFQLGDVNARASQAGQTALMLAVSHGRTDMVRMLLESGADINVQDDDGSTALMCACEHGHTDLVKMILAHPDCDPTVADNDGSTALSIAMEAGHRDVGVLLYAHVNFKQGSPVLARAKHKRKNTSPTSPRFVRR